jgi:putative FmdB family regulatory protein
MPVYEYECGACGHQFEEWQKISDERIKICPKCKKHKVERLISQTAFQLKGGGWYKDLYSSSSKSGSTNAEAKADANGKAKADSKAESKADSKAGDSPGSSKKESGSPGKASPAAATS